MSNRKLSAVVTSFVFVLGACAQQPEPRPVIHPEPIFNKLGVATGCVGGYELDSTSTACEPVDDGCDPSHENCDPWDDDDRPRDPTGRPDPTGLPDPQ